MNQAQCTDWLTHRPVASGVSLTHLYNVAKWLEPPKKRGSKDAEDAERYGQQTLAILDCLFGYPKTAEHIAELTGISRSIVRDRLNKLARRGRVAKHSKTKPYVFKTLDRIRPGVGGVHDPDASGDSGLSSEEYSGPDDFLHRSESYRDFRGVKPVVVAGL